MPDKEPLSAAQRNRMRRLRNETPKVNIKHLQCPDCHGTLTLKVSKYGRFYGCTRWSETGCKGAVSANEDGSPRGIPADKKTRQLRKKVLDAFQEHLPVPDLDFSLQYPLTLELREAAIARRNACVAELCTVLDRNLNTFGVGVLDDQECEKTLAFMKEWAAPKSVWTLILQDDGWADSDLECWPE